MSGSHEAGDVEVVRLAPVGDPPVTFDRAVSEMVRRRQPGLPLAAAARDPRWVLLAPSGDYGILGRRSEPGADDIERAGRALADAGVPGGWVAIMSSSEHADRAPEVMMVRAVGKPAGEFADAVAALLARRAEKAG